MKNSINTMVKYANSMEKSMILIQDKIIES